VAYEGELRGEHAAHEVDAVRENDAVTVTTRAIGGLDLLRVDDLRKARPTVRSTSISQSVRGVAGGRTCSQGSKPSGACLLYSIDTALGVRFTIVAGRFGGLVGRQGAGSE
jgi:hypothetical protein